MAHRTAPTLFLLLVCALLPAAPALDDADYATEGNPALQPQQSSSANTNPEPLIIQLSQLAGSENSHNSTEHSKEATHNSSSWFGVSASSQATLTCTATCPQRPPVPTCPSPCPVVPPCPGPQACPSPCKDCPACPTCERHIPPGYEYFPGFGYYRLHNVPVTWMAAKETCEREGAYLAIINSKEENELIMRLYARDLDIGEWLYIGWHDIYKEGKWVTLFGEPVATASFPNWGSNHPDGKGDCGSMNPGGHFNDLPCSMVEPFVCELFA